LALHTENVRISWKVKLLGAEGQIFIGTLTVILSYFWT